MATITPVRSSPAWNVEKVFWETLTTADTATEIQPAALSGLFGCVQVTGTFGSGTCVLQQSNDGTNWTTVKDTDGNAISFTAAGMANFGTAALFLRPSTSGGTSDDLDVTLILRTQ
jgi:gamma-glutamyltranspeptidase